MTPEQSRRYEAMQNQVVFSCDETSGLERTNSVAWHIELAARIFGQEVGRKAGDGPHPHAMPQDLARWMEGVRTESHVLESPRCLSSSGPGAQTAWSDQAIACQGLRASPGSWTGWPFFCAAGAGTRAVSECGCATPAPHPGPAKAPASARREEKTLAGQSADCPRRVWLGVSSKRER